MRAYSKPLLTFLAVLLASACFHAAPPTYLLGEAAQKASVSSASARTLAFAAFHAWLVEGHATLAEQRIEQALKKDSHEPYAVYGQHLFALRRGNMKQAFTAAMELLEKAPQHPLSSVAARHVLEMAGTSTLWDDDILLRTPVFLERGLPTDAAQLMRMALAQVQEQRGLYTEQEKTMTDAGTPTTFSVLGPLQAFSVLTFDTLTEPEAQGALPASLESPVGTVTRRTMTFPDGRLSLDKESPVGDAYVAAVDVEVAEKAEFVLRVVSSSAHKVYLDGWLALSRRPFEKAEASVSATGLLLTKGRHRLVMRLSKNDSSANLRLHFGRTDGKPSGLLFRPAEGPAPTWNSSSRRTELQGSYPLARDLYATLLPEAGQALASFIAITDSLGRDREGAKVLLNHLKPYDEGPAWNVVRGSLAMSDATLAVKAAHGKAAGAFESALDKDARHVQALLLSASLALEENRLADATQTLHRAAEASENRSHLVPLLLARVHLAGNAEALAEQSVMEALAIQPGLCEALVLRYDLAKRRDAVALADEGAEAQRPCPKAAQLLADHARLRGKTEEATRLFEQWTQREPTRPNPANQLVGLYVSSKRYADALRVLEHMQAMWPRSAGFFAKKKAEVLELAGQPEEALRVREEALAQDGSDLTLHRMVARVKTGKELLEAFAIDGKKAIADYEATKENEDAPSVYVLDAATVQVFPDGSMVDRIHIIQKVLNQSAVSTVAEVDVPAGAQVLQLRTVKADGTTLEPETIVEKDSVSLPGMQVGDYAEVEYLQAHASRGPIQPGFTASSFYFQLFGQANHHSTYTVLAPSSMGMTVDAHHLTAPKIEHRPDGMDVFHHAISHIPPFVAEPNAPPSTTEFLPFVSVGAKTHGNEALLSSYADVFFSKGQRTFEIEAFAKSLTTNASGEDAVRAIYSEVMSRIQGRDGGLIQSAASSLALNRGSRLWLLKATLEAAGFPTRLVAVRTFQVDPATYLFPNEALLPYVCLRVSLPLGKTVWLDTATPNAPYGVLPESAANGKEAYAFPEPGRPLLRLTTPVQPTPRGKTVNLQLNLSKEGTLSGTGEETYTSFEAARLAEALESLPEEQRTQAIQGALSRYFRGADLSQVKMMLPKNNGDDLVVRYEFSVPRFARADGSKWVLSNLTFPSNLSRRYVQMGARQTPLFIDSTEQTTTQLRLELPPGFRVLEPLPKTQVVSAFGRYVREEKSQGNVLEMTEEARLDMARVPPSQYNAFSQFAGDWDVLQSREVVIGP